MVEKAEVGEVIYPSFTELCNGGARMHTWGDHLLALSFWELTPIIT